MESIYNNIKNGAVLSLSVVKKYIFIYYENMHLCFYSIANKEIMFDLILYEGIETYVSDLSTRFRIIKNGNMIEISGDNLHILCHIHVVSTEETVRFMKTIDNGLSIKGGYDSSFIIEDEEEKIVMVGKHNNWVTDACVVDGMLYTVGYDSCIKKWDISRGLCKGYYAIKNGWITSIINNKEDLYIGTQFGEVLRLNIIEINDNPLNQGAVWNIYNYFERIYVVSEDGCISFYDSKIQPVKAINCSSGWINAMTIYNSDLVAVSSCGEIIRVDSKLNTFERIRKVDYWLNNIVIKEYVAFIVSAEGYIICIDLHSQEYRAVKVSRYQLIDIILIGEYIVVADVEGRIYFLNDKLEVMSTIEIPGIHITSMCYNCIRECLYVSTMDEVVVVIDMYQRFDFRLVYIGKVRIWKVDYSIQNQKVAIITTSREIILFDEELKSELMKKKCNDFITTCKIMGGCVLCGDDKGNVTRHELIELCSSDSFENSYKTDKVSGNYCAEIENEIILYYDSEENYSCIYKDRDKKILELCGYDYREEDIAFSDEMKQFVIERSGWSKFPQIIFYGHFISSGSVLPQMYENGTLIKCVGSILEEM